MKPTIVLKQGRESTVLAGHPWIFSGAIKEMPSDLDNGALVSVADAGGQVIATGSYSSRSMIAVRVFAFEDVEIDQAWLRETIRASEQRRRLLGYGGAERTGYRVVYGESDRLPGLVVDRYGDVLVMQLSTVGADRLREEITTVLTELFSPAAIYERSDLVSRQEEGLQPVTGLRNGTLPETVQFACNGRQYLADVAEGQKTGFFLDQEELRDHIAHLAEGREIADLFSYSGAGGLAALMGGAKRVDFVDSSEVALEMCRRHIELNGVDSDRIATDSADVFQWLASRKEPGYDMVLLDPPALIKSRKHAADGRKGYHFLNRAALRLIRDEGILVTSSCSTYFHPDDFVTTLRKASQQEGVDIFLLKSVAQGADHPISLTFPESAYLQSYVLQVRRRS